MIWILVLVIIGLLLWNIWLHLCWNNAKDYAEKWRERLLTRETEKTDTIRKMMIKNLELQSELEEEKRRNALLRQMNERLKG